jgi:FtsP/CotA-like multicopper oxidase with cupredoxin domain
MNKSQRTLVLAAMSLAGASFLPGAASAMDVYLRAEEFTQSLPNGSGNTPVVMWGYRQCYGGFTDCNNPDTGTTNPVTSPGPQITVPAGDSALTIHLQNRLPEPTSLVLPGQPAALAPVLEPDAQGRPRIHAFTKEVPAAVGTTYSDDTYTWDGLNHAGLRTGTYLYQSGSHVQLQVHMGLFGALVHDAPCSPGACAYAGVPYESSKVLVFSEVDPALHASRTPVNANNYAPRFFLVNGEPFPNVPQPAVSAAPGSWVLLRLLNAGIENHAPELLGGYFQVIAEDGNPLSALLKREQHTALLPAAKTLDVLFTPSAPGTFPLFDRRLRLTNDLATGGGMFVRLSSAGSPVVRPTAAPDSFTTTEDTPLNVAAPGVLANDTDPSSLPLQAVFPTPPAKGVVTLNPNGSLVYTPNANANGPDAFTYRVSNGTALSSPATVSLSITPVNDVPVAVNDFFYPTVNSGAFNFGAPGVLANDSDADVGDTLTAVGFTALLNGGTSTLTNTSPTGSFTFTTLTSSTTPYVGQATFTYRAQDNNGAQSPAATASIVKDIAVAIQLTGTGTQAAQRSPVYRNLIGTANDHWQVRGSIRPFSTAITIHFYLGVDDTGTQIGTLNVPANSTTFSFTQVAAAPPAGISTITLVVDVPAAGVVPAHRARILSLPFTRQNN